MLAIPMVDSWGGLPTERHESGAWSQRGLVTHSLRMAFARGIPNRAVRFLTREYGPIGDEFGWRLYAILEYVDHPDAIEYRVRYAAGERSRLRPGHFSSNVLDLTRPWDLQKTPDPRRLSDVSRQRACGLWGGQDNDEHIRQLAFDLWLTRCVSEDLPTLSEIDASSRLFRPAVLARARLGDVTCVPELIPEIRKLSWHFRLAPPVWCTELHELADEYLQSFRAQIPSDFTGGRSDDHFALSELLMEIPRYEAEGLLVDHWGHLRFSPLFIQSALFIGTPRCLALADAAIRECPPGIDILEHVDDHFGVMVSGRQDSVTLEHIERLLPYLDRLEAMSVWTIADFCNRRGHQEWVRRHLQPFLAEGHRADVCPTEADLERKLEEFSR